MSLSSQRSKPHGPAERDPSPQSKAILLGAFADGRYADVDSLASMLASQFPKSAFVFKLWGAALYKLGQLTPALEHTRKAIGLAPQDYQAHNNLGLFQKSAGQLDAAVQSYRRAVALKPDMIEAHSNLAEALREQGKLSEALASYQARLRWAPDDQETRHIVAALSGQTTASAPAEYVEKVFNHYADTFDAHLTGALHYDVPQKLAAWVIEHAAPLGMPPAGTWSVLDLGCGTGLVGQALANQAAHLAGVDLADKMLEQARSKQVYHRLEHADLVGMMQGEASASYDLVVAADVFIYVGQLDAVFEQAARLLKPGGLLAFSIEALAEDQGPYRLMPSGRYAHACGPVQDLGRALGLEVRHLSPTDLRLEGNTPVSGHLAVLQKTANGA